MNRGVPDLILRKNSILSPILNYNIHPLTLLLHYALRCDALKGEPD